MSTKHNFFLFLHVGYLLLDELHLKVIYVYFLGRKSIILLTMQTLILSLNRCIWFGCCLSNGLKLGSI